MTASSTSPISPILANHKNSAALLVLDAKGKVETANAASCQLWKTSITELVVRHFPSLFVFDVVAHGSDWEQVQWEVVTANSSWHSLGLKLQPTTGPAFDVAVHLEHIATEPARYIATITSPLTSAEGSDSLFTNLNEHSPLGFFDLNFVKNEAYYSPVWKRMLGYGESSLANNYETWLALIHPDDSAAAPNRLLSRTPTTGVRPFSAKYRLKHARGYYTWVQSIGAQIYTPSGALQRVVGAHIDIQDRKDYQEPSLHAEERLQMLTERGRIAIFDLDFAGNSTWLSPAFKALLGYAEAELPDTLESFLHTLPANEAFSGLNTYSLPRQPNHSIGFDTLRLRHRNGADLWFYAGFAHIFSRKHDLLRILGFVAPMPESLAVSPISSLSPAHLTELLSKLGEGVLISNARGCVIFVNAKAERLLVSTAAKAIGQPAAKLFRPVHRTSHAPCENPLDRALALGETTEFNNELALDLGTDRTPMPVTFSCRPVFNAIAQPIGVALVFRNPEEMTVTSEELLRTNRFCSLGQLAGGIAHDFNNILTTILGGVSLAKDTCDYSGLDNTERACLAAKALSKQLLTYAKGGASVCQVTKPAEILADAVGLSAVGSAVKVELITAPDLGTIGVNRTQMFQVFQNLIINSIQAMPTGQGNVWVQADNVVLQANQISPLAAGSYITIQVRDNGSGISSTQLDRIFEPFFTTKKTGTGLGLSTALWLVKRHGGQIDVESKLGTGTTFTVFLPRAKGEAEIETRRTPSLRFGTGRVLFMDDDEQISHLTGIMLERLGYKFDLAKNSKEAIQFYKRYLNIGRPYDLVIADLTIVGGMGGKQVFKTLRKLDPEVRAIVASGYDNDDIARHSLEIGFCGYLSKPYGIGDLARVIKKVLGS